MSPSLHDVSLFRCPTLYMYSSAPLFTGCICIKCPTVYRLYLYTGVLLFTCSICVQASHCLHICVQASHYLQAASVFRCPTIYMLHLSSGVPLFTRDSGSVLNILSAVDLSTVHVPKGRQRHHTTFINHTGREFWCLHFTLDLDDICVVRKTHT